MNNDSVSNINDEKNLRDAFSRLADNELPSRELWPEIEGKITLPVTKAYTPKWIPWAFAATLLISFGSFYLSWNNLQNAHLIVAENKFESNLTTDIQSQLISMDKEYGLARAALLAQISLNSAKVDPKILSEVKVNLIIIEQATNELKAAILKQPNDPVLPSLLKTTYQQELVVLTQLAKINLDS